MDIAPDVSEAALDLEIDHDRCRSLAEEFTVRILNTAGLVEPLFHHH